MRRIIKGCAAISFACAITAVMADAQAVVPTHSQTVVKKELWNLQNADIHAVIQTISQITGKNFIVDPRVQGKVTIISTKPMSNKEIYQVFLSMLSVLGYVAIPGKDHVIKIVPAMSARQFGGRLASKAHPGQGDQVVVRVVPVNNVSAMQLVPILRPLMQEWGSVTAYNPSNTLIFAGSAVNINRLVKVVTQMDDNNASQIQVVTLKHANASKISSILEQIQAKNKAEGKVSNVSVVADPENNALLVSGNAANRLHMLSLIKSLDTAQASSAANTVVLHLNYLTAKEIAPILMKIAHGDVARQKGKAGGNAEAMQALSNSDISIEPETNDNSIIISAPPNMIQNLKRVVKALDVAPKEVLVEAVIVQVNEQVANQLGIVWGSRLENSSAEAAAAGIAGGESALSAAGFEQGMGFIPGGNIAGLISALSKNTSADILSTPSILVLNNQSATISNGETVSMVNTSYAANTSSTTNNSTVPFNTLDRRNVALTLKVTPQISPDSTVRLKIAQQDNSLANPTNPGTSPVENTSSIKTTVMVHSGDILVLGGLLKNDHSGGYSKVPILGDLPIIGNLFRYKNKSIQKENLMVFIKPIILNSPAQEKQITNARYNYMRYQEARRRADVNLSENELPPILPARSQQKLLQLPSPFAGEQ